MTDSAESVLEEEIEVLEAIYIHELEVERNESNLVTRISLLLHPSTGDDVDQKFVCMTLTLDISPEYPDMAPDICIKNPRGIGEEEIQSLIEDMITLGQDRQGGPMLYELIELAKESLTEGNIPHCLCMICLEHFHEAERFTKTLCYHYFHGECLARYVKHCQAEPEEVTSLSAIHQKKEERKLVCPVCREPIDYKLDKLPETPVEEKIIFHPSLELRDMQQNMAANMERQQAAGGIINIEEERNKFLLKDNEVVHLSVPSQAVGGQSDEDVPSSLRNNRTDKLRDRRQERNEKSAAGRNDRSDRKGNGRVDRGRNGGSGGGRNNKEGSGRHDMETRNGDRDKRSERNDREMRDGYRDKGSGRGNNRDHRGGNERGGQDGNKTSSRNDNHLRDKDHIRDRDLEERDGINRSDKDVRGGSGRNYREPRNESGREDRDVRGGSGRNYREPRNESGREDRKNQNSPRDGSGGIDFRNNYRDAGDRGNRRNHDRYRGGSWRGDRRNVDSREGRHQSGFGRDCGIKNDNHQIMDRNDTFKGDKDNSKEKEKKNSNVNTEEYVEVTDKGMLSSLQEKSSCRKKLDRSGDARSKSDNCDNKVEEIDAISESPEGNTGGGEKKASQGRSGFGQAANKHSPRDGARNDSYRDRRQGERGGGFRRGFGRPQSARYSKSYETHDAERRDRRQISGDDDGCRDGHKQHRDGFGGPYWGEESKESTKDRASSKSEESHKQLRDDIGGPYRGEESKELAKDSKSSKSDVGHKQHRAGFGGPQLRGESKKSTKDTKSLKSDVGQTYNRSYHRKDSFGKHSNQNARKDHCEERSKFESEKKVCELSNNHEKVLEDEEKKVFPQKGSCTDVIADCNSERVDRVENRSEDKWRGENIQGSGRGRGRGRSRAGGRSWNRKDPGVGSLSNSSTNAADGCVKASSDFCQRNKFNTICDKFAEVNICDSAERQRDSDTVSGVRPPPGFSTEHKDKVKPPPGF